MVSLGGVAVKKLRTFKCSDEEWARWGQVAARKNMALSAWIRQSLNDVQKLQDALDREEKE